ncbi:MAG: hypothetical protein QOJ00_2102 [Actinomycetota bacterium]|jgi:hypothetical protein
MSSKLDIADNLLLVGVVAVVAIVVLGFISAIIGTILFAIKVVIVIAALGIGWRVVTAITGGDKRRELKR